MTLLEAKGLTKHFNGFTAVREVDLAIKRNEIQAIIGPNGAGKTTLFNLLTGTYEVSNGAIYFDDADITDTPPHERPYIGISRGYQITNIYQGQTVAENIQTAVAVFHTNYYDMFRKLETKGSVNEKTEEILELLNLEDQGDLKASTLSHGNKRRLEIGMALAAEPKLLLLDEPTAGMDATETERTMDLVKDVARDKSVLLVEHDIELVMDASDVITVLERGEAIASGSPAAIQENQRVQEAYLGARYA